jgi:prepilin-type N-terminal cleavage/methylation domain-containing protein
MNHKKGILLKKNGFTVWELILSLVILGLLLAVLIPLYLTAKERAAQKSTMADMQMWGDAVALYIEENSVAPPSPRGILTYKKTIIKELTPYLKAIRVVDWWGHAFYVWTRKGDNWYGIPTTTEKDFIIASRGKEGLQEGWKYEPENPESGYFEIEKYKDFEKDLVFWNKKFIRCPISKKQLTDAQLTN